MLLAIPDGSSPKMQMACLFGSPPLKAMTPGTPSEQQEATAQSIVAIPGGCRAGSVSLDSTYIPERILNDSSEYRISAALRTWGSNLIAVKIIREILSSAPKAAFEGQRTFPPSARRPPGITATSRLSLALRIAYPIPAPLSGMSRGSIEPASRVAASLSFLRISSRSCAGVIMGRW